MVQKDLSSAIWHMTKNSEPNQIAAKEAGAIMPLIALLDAGMGSQSTQVKAARCLALMAEQSENKDAIVAAAAVSQLVSPIDGEIEEEIEEEIDREIGGEICGTSASRSG